MTKLNPTSANLDVINDEQLTQVVGGHGHRNHRREYNRYCHGRSERDNYNYDRGCYDSYDRGCYGSSSYGDSSSYGSDSKSSGGSDE
jgi:hypothetical protein